ncbi:YcaO-like family protein [Streptomyces scopuliridis]|uniref:YcaO-like family protein n=1 Tax=Streptomyces scopuliridis TaxID=452529 RepID=UPI002DDA2B7E|nr:YcaO-like family protein [Streptomyces scopuliridis]WSB37907.1 YcaO-like family protein [Streptomyces scopuliridis]
MTRGAARTRSAGVVSPAGAPFGDALAAGLRALVSPYGVMSEVLPGAPVRGLRRLSLASARIGGAPGVERPDEFRGAGRSLDGPEQAALTAIAEGAERYAGADFPGEREVWATAAELDGRVLDMSALPKCSPREYSGGRCPVTLYDPHQRIRWTQGLDLATTEPMWVPAVMARHGIRRLAGAEGFWNRISTGYAVHSDPVEAIVRGIAEVCERDAAAITWLQMLPLRRITFDTPTDDLSTLIEYSDRHFMDTYFFDATTDMGVPTVYCVQTSEYDEACRQIVGCATGRDLPEAAAKTLLETIPARALFHREDPGSFGLIMAGAELMGKARRRQSFDFLLGGHGDTRRQSPPGQPTLPTDSTAALQQLLRALGGRGMQAVAVDRTTRELELAGLTAVCVVIPALQPLTFHRYGQYRAHPRLYDAPAHMGHSVRREEELNPWPQPFL